MNSVDEHRSQAPKRLGFAVLTASDSRDAQRDESGRRIVELVSAAGHRVEGAEIVPDEGQLIRDAVVGALERGADVVVVTGGTGLSRRDVSVEAVDPLLERRIEGFGELFRALSYEQVGAAAMLSRAMAGVVGQGVVFVLPGSPRGVELAMARLILPEVSHLIGQVRR